MTVTWKKLAFEDNAVIKAKINPTGCGIHKDRAKLRLDFFLNPDDPNYDKHHVYVVDETSKEFQQGYKGKIDAEGNPLDLEDYQKWLDSLPHIWQDNPFHTHFIYPNSNISDNALKAEIAKCLNYFYAFHQHCWNESTQFIEEWKKVPSRSGQVRCPFIRGKPEDPKANQSKVQNILLRIQEFQIGISKVPPQDLNIGERGTIDIGPGAINREYVFVFNYTLIDSENPANDTGTIDTFEAWAETTMSGTNKVGTFHGSGTSYTNRDGEVIGTVLSGAKQTFTGLSIDVSTGDFAGIFFSTGRLERDINGVAGVYYKSTDHFGAGVQTYDFLANNIVSIYGTGTEAGYNRILKEDDYALLKGGVNTLLIQ